MNNGNHGIKGNHSNMIIEVGLVNMATIIPR